MWLMHRWPIVGIPAYDKRRPTPVLSGSNDRWKCGESGYAICRSGSRKRNRRWLSDEDGVAWGAPGYGGLQLFNYVVHNIIASRVVGGSSCDDDGMVQSRDALPGNVLLQAG